MEATATKPEEKKARKPRAAGEYLLQRGISEGWEECSGFKFADVAEAKNMCETGT